MEKEQKTVLTKQSFEWHFASMYFEMFRATVMGEVASDKKFQLLFSNLTEYIFEKITPPYHADMDIYVAIEQKIDN